MIATDVKLPSSPYTCFTSDTFGTCSVEHVSHEMYRITDAPDDPSDVGKLVGLVHIPASTTKLAHGGTWSTPAQSSVLWGGRYSGNVNIDPLSEKAILMTPSEIAAKLNAYQKKTLKLAGCSEFAETTVKTATALAELGLVEMHGVGSRRDVELRTLGELVLDCIKRR